MSMDPRLQTLQNSIDQGQVHRVEDKLRYWQALSNNLLQEVDRLRAERDRQEDQIAALRVQLRLERIK